ncbi:MAG: GNAT family N-acetyltransferase [Fimbriimonadaceae bacterium]|nr:GNAT family N-acetyltransferase [Fimbriimonadaceae bacterium]
MRFTVRTARTGDEPGVVSVVRACFEQYGFTWEEDGYCADLHDLKTGYFDHGDLFWVAEIGGRVVGTAGLEFFDRLIGESGTLVVANGKRRVAGADCSLERWYVHPEHRRIGVGRALFETVRDEATRRGRKRMEIWSDKHLVDAHRAYGRYGARLVGDRILDDPDESPEWGFALELDQGRTSDRP